MTVALLYRCLHLTEGCTARQGPLTLDTNKHLPSMPRACSDNMRTKTRGSYNRGGSSSGQSPADQRQLHTGLRWPRYPGQSERDHVADEQGTARRERQRSSVRLQVQIISKQRTLPESPCCVCRPVGVLTCSTVEEPSRPLNHGW